MYIKIIMKRILFLYYQQNVFYSHYMAYICKVLFHQLTVKILPHAYVVFHIIFTSAKRCRRFSVLSFLEKNK